MSDTDTDLQLLARYARHQAEDAFEELVRRHLDLVHSAAQRQVRSPQLAEEVAQSTFITLAEHAQKLAPDTILSAWLYQVTRRAAIDVIRREARRQLREQIATEMYTMNATADDWAHIEPLLDEAMHALDETDRTAILLRYFENKSLREVGQTLGTSDDAAQKRVSRAVERLREFFAKRGLTVGASGLVVVLSANAVQAAPVGLIATIATATALSGTALLIVTTAKNATVNAFNSKSVVAIVVTAVAAGPGTHILQKRTIDRLRSDNQALATAEKQLRNERDSVLSVAKARMEDLERMRKGQSELLRLRGEVSQLRLQIESQNAQAAVQLTPPEVAKAAGGHPPGSYIAMNQLAHAGYQTPEAALETITWAMMKGTYEQVNEGAGKDILADELNDPKAREHFEAGQKRVAPLFRGMQIIARKVMAADEVELKVKLDYDPAAGEINPSLPTISIQPMVRIGDECKITGSTRAYLEGWENDGQIQTFTQ